MSFQNVMLNDNCFTVSQKSSYIWIVFLFKFQLVWGMVSCVEDHGFTVSLGEKLSCFLPKNQTMHPSMYFAFIQ